MCVSVCVGVRKLNYIWILWVCLCVWSVFSQNFLFTCVSSICSCWSPSMKEEIVWTCDCCQLIRTFTLKFKDSNGLKFQYSVLEHVWIVSWFVFVVILAKPTSSEVLMIQFFIIIWIDTPNKNKTKKKKSFQAFRVFALDVDECAPIKNMTLIA